MNITEPRHNLFPKSLSIASVCASILKALTGQPAAHKSANAGGVPK